MNHETLKLVADILEATMIIGFGISWPFNLAKSIKTKSAKGKSLPFLLFIDCGYVAGIASKIINPDFDWNTRWWIFAFYVLNFIMVTLDLTLYFINRKRDKKLEENKNEEK